MNGEAAFENTKNFVGYRIVEIGVMLVSVTLFVSCGRGTDP